jgi:hypothetical protein
VVYARLSRKFEPAPGLSVLVDEVLPGREGRPGNTEADLAIAADKLDAVKGNVGHTELFEGLSGIQNWKPAYNGKNRIQA